MSRVKFIVLPALTFLVLFLACCRKDTAIVSTATTVSLIKTAVIDSGYVNTYTYDSLGRQIMAQIDTVVTTYAYGQGYVLQTIALAGEQFINDYTTNASGLATSDTKGYVYIYNSSGYLISKSYTGTGNFDSITYTISGGNVTTSVEHQADSATNNTITTTYTYLPNIDSRGFGLAFLGRANTNLINTVAITQIIGGSTYSVSSTYTYSYDSRGRVAQQVINNGSASYTSTYTYY